MHVERLQGGGTRKDNPAGALAALAFALTPAIGFAADETPAPEAAQTPATAAVTTESGLQYTDEVVGTGAMPKPGQTCVMNYTGWLYKDGVKGRKFDSLLDHGKPFQFPIGERAVIAGWDEGVATMKVGGKRTLILPPHLGY